MVTPDEIRTAYGRIRPYVRRTPLLTLEPSGALGLGLDRPLSLKLEFLQKSGTFKARGAFNQLLSRKVPAAGVCTASGGNHGAAVAIASAELGVKARIFVPSTSPAPKVKRIRDSGAELVVGGAQYPEALAACERYAAESGAIAVHAYDAWETMAGQGTVGLEWEEDATGGLDTVLVACGGGGLVGGIAAWFRRRVKVVAVEPENSRALHAALAAGGPVDVDVQSVAADSLGARNVFAKVHEVAAAFVDHVALVPDEAITAAQTELWTQLRAALEPGGATAFAALRCRAYRPAKGERVGVLLCGSNVDLGSIAV